jgi:hypothetical protein
MFICETYIAEHKARKLVLIVSHIIVPNQEQKNTFITSMYVTLYYQNKFRTLVCIMIYVTFHISNIIKVW